jgi:hypothetical protein
MEVHMNRITKRITGLITTVGMIVMVLCLTSCGKEEKVNMRNTLPGEWFVWHWYYVEGDNGFYDNAVFYTFTEDGKLTIQEHVENSEVKEATYTWDNDYTIIVSYEDGTSETFEITPTTHDGHDQLKYTNVDTGLILSMEPMSDWSED